MRYGTTVVAVGSLVLGQVDMLVTVDAHDVIADQRRQVDIGRQVFAACHLIAQLSDNSIKASNRTACQRIGERDEQFGEIVRVTAPRPCAVGQEAAALQQRDNFYLSLYLSIYPCEST